ncbi:hypothetical protein ACFLYO_11010 [Chloroflexota bacterium]
MATWTTLNNLSTGDLVTETDMDALRGNIEYLLNPNTASDYSSSYDSTTSTSFVDSGVEAEITSYGGVLLLLFQCRAQTTTDTHVQFRFTVDGDPLTFEIDERFPGEDVMSLTEAVSVAAGTHTVKVQFRVTSAASVSIINSGLTVMEG